MMGMPRYMAFATSSYRSHQYLCRSRFLCCLYFASTIFQLDFGTIPTVWYFFYLHFIIDLGDILYGRYHLFIYPYYQIINIIYTIKIKQQNIHVRQCRQLETSNHGLFSKSCTIMKHTCECYVHALCLSMFLQSDFLLQYVLILHCTIVVGWLMSSGKNVVYNSGQEQFQRYKYKIYSIERGRGQP